MKKYLLHIFAYEDGGDILNSLSSIHDDSSRNAEVHLFCAYRHHDKTNEILEQCEQLKKEHVINAFTLLHISEESSYEETANAVFLHKKYAVNKNSFLFFLSSTISVLPFTLSILLDRLTAEDNTAGLNPLILAGWRKSKEHRIAHMGTVCDCQKQLHYLYEGLPLSNPLTQKKRFFQMAHPGAVLIRHMDFISVGGFKTAFAPLSFAVLCIKLTTLRPHGFSTEPNSKAILHNSFDSWESCGTWNSILQRGRLHTDGIAINYPYIVENDRLEYKVDAWLCEHANNLPLELTPNSIEEAWLSWRHTPNPLSLLKYISSLPEHQKQYAITLCRTLPASLPRTITYYTAQCEKIRFFAVTNHLTQLAVQTREWIKKTAQFHYKLLKPCIHLLHKMGMYACSLDTSPAVFDAWLEISKHNERIDNGNDWPKIAVLMPVWNPNPEFLIQAIQSVHSQTYKNWQFCIADDASTNPLIPELLRSYARDDKRISLMIRSQNGHICQASNSALELVDAPYTAFLDHDDMLAPEALSMVAQRIADNSSLGYIYSDNDHIDCCNVRYDPAFKPDFDADLFYTGHLSTFATDLIHKVGGLRIGTEGAQDQDLRLRVTELLSMREIAHIPHILYHWRVHAGSTAGGLATKPYMVDAIRRVLLDAAQRRGIQAELVDAGKNNFFRLANAIPANMTCTVILLTDANAPHISKNIFTYLEKAQEKIDIEIYIQPLCKQPIHTLHTETLPVQTLPYVGERWVAACNAAAAHAKGMIVFYLYAGLQPAHDCNIEQLLIQATRLDLAITGGIIWKNNRLLHGGWYPDSTGMPFQLLRGTPYADISSSSWGQFLLPRHTIGVSWQCMAVRKDILKENIFLDESFGELALVDFSLRHIQKNRHTLVSPWGQWDSTCIIPEKSPNIQEINLFRERWGETVKTCGLRNPNLRMAPDNNWTLTM